MAPVSHVAFAALPSLERGPGNDVVDDLLRLSHEETLSRSNVLLTN